MPSHDYTTWTDAELNRAVAERMGIEGKEQPPIIEMMEGVKVWPPDFLHDWNAFGRLWEWIVGHEYNVFVEMGHTLRGPHIAVRVDDRTIVGDMRRGLVVAFLAATDDAEWRRRNE